MQKFWKAVSLAGFFICAAVLGIAFWGARTLPDSYTSVDGTLRLGVLFSAQAQTDARVAFAADDEENETGAAYDVRLLNVVPVKTVSVHLAQRRYLAVGGELVGVTMKTKGVLVVGTEKFTADNGAAVCPAADAGIKKGDTVLSVNGIPAEGNDTLTRAIEAGAPLTLEILRGDETMTVTLTPQKTAATGLYKGGLWVRDSTVGVGTLTYCDIENGRIAALGHGIYDTDTSALLTAAGGEISTATVSSVKKGACGSPGEITGVIGTNTLGSITENAEEGVFGELYYMQDAPEVYPVATFSEVHTGEAQVICTVTGGKKEAYDIEITHLGTEDGTQSMTVKITDQTLLSLTGGIVQGMSGSPILQDGMLAGAVTHVFVNDPKSGYAIYAQTMLEKDG